MTEGPAPTVVWEAAKENIQPLRRGRNITFLTEALTMNSDMLEEKKRYEISLYSHINNRSGN